MRQDLVAMLKALIAAGVEVKVCGTCMARCGVHKNQPYYPGSDSSAPWIAGPDPP